MLNTRLLVTCFLLVLLHYAVAQTGVVFRLRFDRETTFVTPVRRSPNENAYTTPTSIVNGALGTTPYTFSGSSNSGYEETNSFVMFIAQDTSGRNSLVFLNDAPCVSNLFASQIYEKPTNRACDQDGALTHMRVTVERNCDSSGNNCLPYTNHGIVDQTTGRGTGDVLLQGSASDPCPKVSSGRVQDCVQWNSTYFTFFHHGQLRKPLPWLGLPVGWQQGHLKTHLLR